MQKLSSLSVIFPAFNDAKSIPLLVKKINPIAIQFSNKHEIIIVNDGSKDKTALVLLRLQKKYPIVIVTHRVNKGYGAALWSGFKKARNEFIFYTDGDGQYDVAEIKRLIVLMDEQTDLVNGFKISRSDPWYRRIVGFLYNVFCRLFLGMKLKDIDCDFRLFRRTILKNIEKPTSSGLFNLLLWSQLQRRGIRIKQVRVHHFKRQYGKSEFFKAQHLLKSLADIKKLLLIKIHYE